jgi:signal transduction histidine kinase
MEKMLSPAASQSELAAMREKLRSPIKLADMALSVTRRIASELRPSVLDDLGLAAAIEWQAQQFQARTGIVCDCDCSLETLELSEQQSTAVFRILQEALTNVLRHAQATRVDIKIRIEDGHFILAVSDNGKGITKAEKPEQQLGILGMRERAHLIGGELTINGGEGKGTAVIVRVPLLGQERVLKMTR